jgi:hypothetical protein
MPKSSSREAAGLEIAIDEASQGSGLGMSPTRKSKAQAGRMIYEKAIPSVLALFSALSLLVAGCGRRGEPEFASTDAKLRRVMIGTWMRESNGEIKLASNGSFTSAWTNLHSDPAKVWTYEGKWWVTNGAWFSTCTKNRAWGTTNVDAVGSTDFFNIIRVDASELVWESYGQTNLLTRGK